MTKDKTTHTSYLCLTSRKCQERYRTPTPIPVQSHPSCQSTRTTKYRQSTPPPPHHLKSEKPPQLTIPPRRRFLSIPPFASLPVKQTTSVEHVPNPDSPLSIPLHHHRTAKPSPENVPSSPPTGSHLDLNVSDANRSGTRALSSRSEAINQ